MVADMVKKIYVSLSNTMKKIDKSSLMSIVILFLLIASYVFVFSILTVDRHNRFGTSAYDLGQNDQQIWHHSRFSPLFNTIRGMHALGDHFFLINAIISPIYWFFDDVRALLVLQALALAAAAIPLFLIAKHYFRNKWIPLVFCFSYLLLPALQYGNFEDYHTEAFVPFFILFAFYFIIKGKKWPYLIFFLLTLTEKEDIALTMFLMGFYIYFKHDKKVGIFTSVFSLFWFFLATKIFMPHFNEAGFMYAGRGLGNFGNTPVEIIFGILNPKNLFPVLFNEINATYVWELFSPVAFIPFLNLPTLIISASLWVNLVASWPYAHSIHYHYTIPIIPFMFISMVIGIARFKKRKIIVYSLLSLLIISAVVSNYYLAPYDASMKNYEQFKAKVKNFNIASESEAERYHMISLIPKNASVSASYEIVPHLTHRNKIYMFTNPFKNEYWGNPGDVPPLEYVDYLLLRKNQMEEHNLILKPLLENNTYESIYESAEYKLFKRQH